MPRWNDIDLAALRRVIVRYGAASVRRQVDAVVAGQQPRRGPTARSAEFNRLVWVMVERRAAELERAGAKRRTRAVSEACRQIAAELRAKFPSWQIGPDRTRRIHSAEQKQLRELERRHLARGMRVLLRPAATESDVGAKAAGLTKPRRRIERS